MKTAGEQFDGAVGELAGVHAASTRRGLWTVRATLLIVFIFQLWIVTAGTWVEWPTYTRYYDRLADAFLRGQTHLLELPDPRILALRDPYDPAENWRYRLHDATLFEGRYYLYWGPIPALFVAAIRVLGCPSVPDQLLAFAFSCLTTLAAAGLLTRVRTDHFANVPAWTIAIGILVVGLANPMPFMLGRAAVYEAAILAGQMFLLVGYYFAVCALNRPVISRAGLFACGFAFACAVGSRPSLVAAVLISMTVVGFVAWLRSRGSGVRNVRLTLAALIMPLLVGLICLGTYNFARFRSVTEFGVRNQLAAFNSHADFGRLTSWGNIVPNLWAYLARPPILTKAFPFALPRKGTDPHALPPFIHPPAFQIADEATAGLLIVSPFALLALLPAVALLWPPRGRRGRHGPSIGSEGPWTFPADEKWLVAMLLLSAVAAMPPALVLGLSSMRYQADWTPTVLLLATIGMWTGYGRFAGVKGRSAWSALVLVLAGVSIGFGPLLGVTSAADHFWRYNPELMRRLVSLTASHN